MPPAAAAAAAAGREGGQETKSKKEISTVLGAGRWRRIKLTAVLMTALPSALHLLSWPLALRQPPQHLLLGPCQCHRSHEQR